MEITRRVVFHTGHMLKDDTSKCYQPHGHEYVLECTIKGAVQEDGAENGMVMNFSGLKEIMMEEVHDRFDHLFIIDKEDPRAYNFARAVPGGFYILDKPPTAENLVRYCFELIQSKLPQGIKIAKLKLQETYQCWVEYDGNN